MSAYESSDIRRSTMEFLKFCGPVDAAGDLNGEKRKSQGTCGVKSSTRINGGTRKGSVEWTQGERLKVMLMAMIVLLGQLQSQVGKVVGQAVSFDPQSPQSLSQPPTGVNTSAPSDATQAPNSQPSPSSAPSTAPEPSSPTPLPGQTQQFQQVISSLRARNYSVGARFFGGLLPLLSLNSTIFVPNDQAFVGLGLSPPLLTIVMSYHAVIQQIPLAQLLTLPLEARLTTTLGNTIMVTSNARNNFRVDNVRIVEGDLCSSNMSALQYSCHGIEALLNAAEWGTATDLSPLTLAPAPTPSTLAPISGHSPISPLILAPPSIGPEPVPESPSESSDSSDSDEPDYSGATTKSLGNRVLFSLAFLILFGIYFAALVV